MKKAILHLRLLGLALVVFACNNKGASHSRDVNLADLKSNVGYRLREMDSTYRLDSFRFIKLDTITKFHEYAALEQRMASDLTLLLQQLKYHNIKTQSNIDQVKLYAMLDSKTLTDIAKDDAKEEMEKAKEVSELIDSLQVDHNAIIKLMKTADTTKPIFFYAVSLVQYKKPNQVTVRDSFYTLLDLDKNIIEHDWYAGYKYRNDVKRITGIDY